MLAFIRVFTTDDQALRNNHAHKITNPYKIPVIGAGLIVGIQIVLMLFKKKKVRPDAVLSSKRYTASSHQPTIHCTEVNDHDHFI